MRILKDKRGRRRLTRRLKGLKKVKEKEDGKHQWLDEGRPHLCIETAAVDHHLHHSRALHCSRNNSNLPIRSPCQHTIHIFIAHHACTCVCVHYTYILFTFHLYLVSKAHSNPNSLDPQWILAFPSFLALPPSSILLPKTKHSERKFIKFFICTLIASNYTQETRHYVLYYHSNSNSYF